MIGGLAAVHQFCRIGAMSIIGGCSKVVQDVPPYMLADGNPAKTRTINKVGLERNGVSEEAQAALKQAYKILFREGPDHSQRAGQNRRRNCRAPAGIAALGGFRPRQRTGHQQVTAAGDRSTWRRPAEWPPYRASASRR